jgi:hypothetical protein
MDWQPIDTAPKDGTPIELCGIRTGAAQRLGVREHKPAHWNGWCWWMLDRPGGIIGMRVHATHWRPLRQV